MACSASRSWRIRHVDRARDRIFSRKLRGSVTDFSMWRWSLRVPYRLTITYAVRCNGKRPWSMRTRRVFRPLPSRIWHSRPISGLCLKGHEVTLSSLTNAGEGPESVPRRYCNESKHTVFEYAETRPKADDGRSR